MARLALETKLILSFLDFEEAGFGGDLIETADGAAECSSTY